MTEPTTTDSAGGQDSPYPDNNVKWPMCAQCRNNLNKLESGDVEWHLANCICPCHQTTTDSGIDLGALEQDLEDGVENFGRADVRALIERLRAAEAAHQEQIGREMRVRNNVIAGLEAERDELKESLRTTRLEQAAKAFQVDELETKVARLEAERNEAEEQVRTLTTERDTAKGHIKGWIEREARLSVEHMDELEQLQEQVERLTEELAAIGETSQPNSAV